MFSAYHLSVLLILTLRLGVFAGNSASFFNGQDQLSDTAQGTAPLFHSSPPYEGGVAGFSSPPVLGGVAAASADGVVSDRVVLSPSEKPTKVGTPNIDTWLLTDAGFNILLSMETYKWYYHLVSAERANDPHKTPYKLAGPLCDGGDVYFDIEGENRLPPYRMLPEGVKPGEVLALLNCGAYSLAQASQYNGRFLPPVILIGTNGEPELIRKRDSFEDLVANDVF